ncbi:MAG: hypothetical protein AAFQ51_18015, partial [Pseudomonadota bacterium]
TIFAFMDTDTDQDWFRIELNPDDTLRLQGFQDGSPIGFRLQLRDETGAVVDAGQAGLFGGRELDFTTTEGGTFFVSVEGLGDFGTQGNTISVQAFISRDEIGDTPETARFISEEDPFAAGAIQGGLADTDVFSFSATAGQSLNFQISTTDSRAVPMVATLSDAAGNVLLERSASPTSILDVPFFYAASGDYFVSLRSAVDPATGEAPDFSYSVALLGQSDDFGASPDTAFSTTVGASVDGVIDFEGDLDWFSVDLNAGEEVLFNAVAGDFLFETGITVRLRDTSGALIAEGVTGADQFTLSEFSRLSFTPEANRTVIVEVQSGDIQTGNYSLVIADVNDPVAGDASTTATLLFDNTATPGLFETDTDEDWYALTVEAGDTALFDLEADFTVELSLVDASGAPLPGRSSDVRADPFARQSLAYEFEDAGTFYLKLTAEDLSAFSLPASYEVSANFYEDDFASNPSTLGVLPNDGTPVDGTTEVRGELDWFKFTPEAGAAYLIDLFANDGSGNFGADSLRVFDAAGNEVTPFEAPSGGTATSGSWYFPDDGPYFVQATAPLVGEARTYQLSVTASPDDHGDSAATATPIIPDSETEYFALLEAPGDQDWFSFSAT